MKDICLVQKDQKVEGNLLKILVQQYPLQLTIFLITTISENTFQQVGQEFDRGAFERPFLPV